MFYDVTGTTDLALTGNRRATVVGILLHTTNGVSSLAWLQRNSLLAGKAASADFLLARNGDLYRIVGRGRYSYHAGKSCFGQWTDDEVSQRFIGIEIENDDEALQAPTQKQYDTLGALVTQLIKDGELPKNYILLAHSGVATPWGRRADPWNFDYHRIIWP